MDKVFWWQRLEERKSFLSGRMCLKFLQKFFLEQQILLEETIFVQHYI